MKGLIKAPQICLDVPFPSPGIVCIGDWRSTVLKTSRSVLLCLKRGEAESFYT